MEAVFIFPFTVFMIILVVAIVIMQNESHTRQINEKIRSLGGEAVDIQRAGLFTGLGPFKIVGKGRVVYKIEYKVKNKTKTGWVRFGGWSGPDWRL